jgi:hypothetical protein
VDELPLLLEEPHAARAMPLATRTIPRARLVLIIDRRVRPPAVGTADEGGVSGLHTMVSFRSDAPSPLAGRTSPASQVDSDDRTRYHGRVPGVAPREAKVRIPRDRIRRLQHIPGRVCRNSVQSRRGLREYSSRLPTAQTDWGGGGLRRTWSVGSVASASGSRTATGTSILVDRVPRCTGSAAMRCREPRTRSGSYGGRARVGLEAVVLVTPFNLSRSRDVAAE